MNKTGLKNLLIGMLVTLLALPPQGLAQDAGNDLPDIGSPASSVLSLDDEYRIGLQIVRQLRDEGQIVDDPESTEYLQSLGSQIVAQATGDSAQRFHFFFVRDDTINAFALPGGFIGVNYGLVLATRNEAQLAGVLAHEIAHVTQRHIARRVRSQGRQSIATMAAIVASILLGAATGSSDAAMGGISMAQGAAMQQQINFTRANENEADRVGMGFLAAAGFDPYGMPDFFETMGGVQHFGHAPQCAAGNPAVSPGHHQPHRRIALARRAVQGRQPGTRERELFADARTAARPVHAAGGQRAPLLCRPARTAGADGGRTLRRGAGQLPGRKFPAALDSLTELARDYPQVPMLQSTLGQALMSAGATDAALDTFRRALSLSPRNIPLTMRYAEALLKAGEAKTAHAVLLDLFNNVAPTPAQIRFTALAASSAGDTADAAYYMSEYHIATGNLPLSVAQLEWRSRCPTSPPCSAAASRHVSMRCAKSCSRTARSAETAPKQEPKEGNPSQDARWLGSLAELREASSWQNSAGFANTSGESRAAR